MGPVFVGYFTELASSDPVSKEDISLMGVSCAYKDLTKCCHDIEEPPPPCLRLTTVLNGLLI